MVRVRRQAGVGAPGDLLVLLEPLRQCQAVRAVPLHAQRERLDALQVEEGLERVQAGAQVPKDLDAAFADEGGRAERVGVDQAVVAFRRLGEAREAPVLPVELARLLSCQPLLSVRAGNEHQ